MAAKNRVKGTVLAVDISAVYTAIPQIISISKSGEAGTTYDGKTIDGAVHGDMPSDGFVSNPTIGFDIFLDTGNAVHAYLYTTMRTPPTAGQNFKLTDTASTPRVEIWNVTSIGIDETYALGDGVKASVTCQTSGNPS